MFGSIDNVGRDFEQYYLKKGLKCKIIILAQQTGQRGIKSKLCEEMYFNKLVAFVQEQ